MLETNHLCRPRVVIPEGICRGSSSAMQRIIKALDRAAGSDFPVLLFGESGTGKELLARRLHQLSLRAEKPSIFTARRSRQETKVLPSCTNRVAALFLAGKCA